MSKPKDKRHYYKTARAAISCARFKLGEIVAVKYSHQGTNGVHWFTVNGTVPYPEHHLTDFVL